MTCTEVAKMLMTTTRQVHAWHKRRHTSGFPEPIGSVLVPTGGGRRGGPFFDPQEVVDWFVRYDPDANRGAHWAKKRKAV